MSVGAGLEISPGALVEFFESKKILLGVCLTVKGSRLGLLAETNREMTLPRSRILHVNRKIVSVNEEREKLLDLMRRTKIRRENLASQVNAEEIWSVVQDEPGGFSSQDLAGLVFPGDPDDDCIAALQRALLADQLYFRFKEGFFWPRSEEKVEFRRAELERQAEREAFLETGARWLKEFPSHPKDHVPAKMRSVVDLLKDYYLFGQECSSYALVKDLLRKASIPLQPSTIFRLLVRMGEWTEDENTYLCQQGIERDFPKTVLDEAERCVASPLEEAQSGRSDWTDRFIFTVDSESTLDFDDALSLRPLPSGWFEVAVHIADPDVVVKPGTEVDQEAARRVTSIYLPDTKISMLPPRLSEDVCSLKKDHPRLAITFVFQVDPEGTIHGSDILLTIVRVKEQYTYGEVNQRMDHDENLRWLHRLSLILRSKRIEQGAVVLPLPEIDVKVNPQGMIHLVRHEKESPAQQMVSEWMIAANALAAERLKKAGVPAIFRRQAECRPETQHVQSDYPIFHIYRQRRLFARAELGLEAGPHCSLGLPVYTTVTSPIRRYMDLVVMRQLKSILCGSTPPYDASTLERMITHINVQMGRVLHVQRKWTRYWLLKYLEQEDIQSMNALVLDRNARFAHLLVPEYLMEIRAPLPEEGEVRAGEMVRVRLEHLHPRDDVLKVRIV